MSTINISREHQLNAAECGEALVELSDYLGGLGAKVTRDGDNIAFRGPSFEGEVCIEPGLASARIKLGLMARAFKSQLEREINSHLDARLDAD